MTPNPDAVFTAIQFSTQFDGVNAVDPKTVFELPIQTQCMAALITTIPFPVRNGLRSGIAMVNWFVMKPSPGMVVQAALAVTPNVSNPIGGWLAGSYEVQIFMGYDWKVIGRFIVIGPPNATPAPTGTPTFTQVPSALLHKRLVVCNLQMTCVM